MRFGMSGCFLPADMNDLTPAMCQRARAGLSGIFTRFHANDPRTASKAEGHPRGRSAGGRRVRMYQATGFWQNR
ncbi:MAG: hypothetical protein R2911_26105 [Caldilineaceae bacterium]